jgi:two-component system sensor histidine kinase/response regulator
LGVGAWLSKPIRQSELLEAILSLLGTPSVVENTVPVMAGATAAGAINQERSGKLQILLAEDNVVNQRLAIGMLTKAGHSVEVAANGKEAFEFWARARSREQGPYDLVLMDVQMPVMDGFEATGAIRAEEELTGGHVTIIAMTAHAMKGDRERCLEANMDGYLSKPINAKTLFNTIEKVAATTARRGGSEPTNAAADEKLDLAAAGRRIGADPELLAEIAGLFVEQYPKLLAEMDRAVALGDGTSLERVAHSLKGAVANFGADAAVNDADRIETLGHAGDFVAAREAVALLRNELERIRPALIEAGTSLAALAS